MAEIGTDRTTDDTGIIVYPERRMGSGPERKLTFMTPQRAAEVASEIRDCEARIRRSAPNCVVADAIGDVALAIERPFHPRPTP